MWAASLEENFLLPFVSNKSRLSSFYRMWFALDFIHLCMDLTLSIQSILMHKWIKSNVNHLSSSFLPSSSFLSYNFWFFDLFQCSIPLDITAQGCGQAERTSTTSRYDVHTPYCLVPQMQQTKADDHSETTLRALLIEKMYETRESKSAITNVIWVDSFVVGVTNKDIFVWSEEGEYRQHLETPPISNTVPRFADPQTYQHAEITDAVIGKDRLNRLSMYLELGWLEITATLHPFEILCAMHKKFQKDEELRLFPAIPVPFAHLCCFACMNNGGIQLWKAIVRGNSKCSHIPRLLNRSTRFAVQKLWSKIWKWMQSFCTPWSIIWFMWGPERR